MRKRGPSKISSTYLLGANEGLVAACARPDGAGIYAWHWAEATHSFEHADLGQDAHALLTDFCRPVRVLAQLRAPVDLDLERRRAWALELEDLVRGVDLPFGDFAAALQMEAGVKPCSAQP